jgi:uncharacterized protein YeaO (DUF488 family)
LIIAVKRIYSAPDDADGVRILVDRLWPRGMKKATTKIDAWVKEIAPSTELRQWYGHDPKKWNEFRKRYFAELEAKPELLDQLREQMGEGPVTFLYGSREDKLNNAMALREYLERQRAVT